MERNLGEDGPDSWRFAHGGAVAREDDAQAEMLRNFQAAISGDGVGDLRQLAGELTLISRMAALHSVRPDCAGCPMTSS